MPHEIMVLDYGLAHKLLSLIDGRFLKSILPFHLQV